MLVLLECLVVVVPMIASMQRWSEEREKERRKDQTMKKKEQT